MLWFPKNRKQIREIRLVVGFLRDHLAQFEEKSETIDPTLVEVTRFLILEFIDAYESIGTLYGKNHFKGCLILARSIFESAINLEYIYKAQNIELTARNYRGFSVREYLSRAEKIESDELEKSGLIQALRREAEGYAPSGKDTRHWDGKNLREMAIESENEWSYRFFKQLSNYNHGKFRTSRDFSTHRPYNDYLHDIVSRHSIMSALGAIQEVATKFDLEGGVMFLTGYPDDGKNVIFATSPKKAEEFMAEHAK